MAKGVCGPSCTARFYMGRSVIRYALAGFSGLPVAFRRTLAAFPGVPVALRSGAGTPHRKATQGTSGLPLRRASPSRPGTPNPNDSSAVAGRNSGYPQRLVTSLSLCGRSWSRFARHSTLTSPILAHASGYSGALGALLRCVSAFNTALHWLGDCRAFFARSPGDFPPEAPNSSP